MFNANPSIPYDFASVMSYSQSLIAYVETMPTMKCAKTSFPLGVPVATGARDMEVDAVNRVGVAGAWVALTGVTVVVALEEMASVGVGATYFVASIVTVIVVVAR